MGVRTGRTRDDGPQPWARAWTRAARGEGGFYTDGPGALDGPAAHFRTSAHVGPGLARAIVALLHEVDARLGGPEHLDVVDVGAGRGELLVRVLDLADADLAARLRPTAVDVRPRPHGLDARIAWIDEPAPRGVPDGVRGLVLANEWLDDVPLDVVEVDEHGTVRLVLVDHDGRETWGPPLHDGPAWSALGLDAAAAAGWLERWWPVGRPGERAEIGRSRDEHWDACVRRLTAGTALAIDYGHTRDQRATGCWAAGTLTAYRDGRLAAAVPDGTVNLTAHVAVDATAAAVGGVLTRQREALRALGVSARLPERALAQRDPTAYADALVTASEGSELLDPAGLGGFAWIRVDR